VPGPIYSADGNELKECVQKYQRKFDIEIFLVENEEITDTLSVA
jgi:hypothetical protein